MTDNETDNLATLAADAAAVETPDPSAPASPPAEAESRGGQGGRRHRKQFKRDKRDVHGWVVLDKPVGMTSTHAVSVIKHLFTAKRCGHAGTLDPLASGALPIAMGEATKTVPFVMDGRKLYRFTIRWGEERDTDDAEGRVVAQSDQRPTAEAIQAMLPAYIGTIQQVPPRYSAIKIEGERRAGGRMRQGHLCPVAGPRYRGGAGLLRPCQRAPAHRGRPVRPRKHDFAGRSGGSMP